MIVYSDTSALVKLVGIEPGSDEMVELAGRAQPMASVAIAYVELRAAAAASIRGGRLHDSDAQEMHSRVEGLWSQVNPIVVDDRLIKQAGQVADDHGLRGYDAVHLAALRRLGPSEEIVFACWDRELRDAAAILGYTVFPERIARS